MAYNLAIYRNTAGCDARRCRRGDIEREPECQRQVAAPLQRLCCLLLRCNCAARSTSAIEGANTTYTAIRCADHGPSGCLALPLGADEVATRPYLSLAAVY